jgi:hypothetical protein
MRVATLRKFEITKIALDEALSTLLEELGEECQNTLKLLTQLKTTYPDTEQIEDILAELTASVVHLHAHTDGLDDLIRRCTCTVLPNFYFPISSFKP